MKYGIFTDPDNHSFSTTKFDRVVYTGLFVFLVIMGVINGEIFNEFKFFALLVGVLTGLGSAGMFKSYMEKKLKNGNNGKTD